jgi:ATP-dependent Clp protease protease subunit
VTGSRPDPFDPRLILLHGELDDRVAGELAVRLMTLDAVGDEPISLYIDSGDGSLNAALAVIDTVDLLGVPVHATAVGRVEGPALGVLAACELRRASPNARLRLRAPQDAFAGRASQADGWLAQHRDRLDRFVTRLAASTGQPSDRIEADLSAGLSLDPPSAVRYGLIDEVWGRPIVAPRRGNVRPIRAPDG